MFKRSLGISLLTFLVSLAAFADESLPTNKLFYTNRIDFNSVKVVDSRELAPGFHDVTLEFRILPSNSCQENYVGFSPQGLNEYLATYETTPDARCKMFARPRAVKQKIFVNLLDSHSVKLILNRHSYQLTQGQQGLQIE